LVADYRLPAVPPDQGLEYLETGVASVAGSWSLGIPLGAIGGELFP
jgi:hypothetical protein